ncbi:MAG: ferredoxin-thioredoxin reductase catalytic domain-containing protein [Actinomycetota bacterium]|nr:ferredoxin-thioredoxin reductase catalytic domain-containing protein [Actinomycetota bacterium]
MKEIINIEDKDLDKAYKKINKDAIENGYFINTDESFSKELVRSLLINEKRYGYQACPCRLASGIKDKDIDIICPCDYRDEDLNDYGACYCALYVSEEIIKGGKKLTSIPERRNKEVKNYEKRKEDFKIKSKKEVSELKYPVYRCKVCGYLCARNNPPEICPVCKAKKDRFERFI